MSGSEQDLTRAIAASAHDAAARELAEMRRMATNERRGLLSRLMGKKE